MGILKLEPPSYLPSVLLVAALIVAVVVAYRLWNEVNEDEEPASPYDMLGDFEEAHAAGELDADELRRVRESLRKPPLPVDKSPRAKEPPPGDDEPKPSIM